MASSVTFTAINAEVSSAPPAVLYDNTPANLNLVLTNNLGQDVTVPANGLAFSIVCPRCFDLTNATMTPPAGMTVNPNGMSFDFSAGATDLDWANGSSLTCTLNSVQSEGPDGTYFLTMVSGNSSLPRQLMATVAVQAAPVDENADLSTVLALSFQPDDFNEVYVSTIQPFLLNTLTFNINNQSNAPIYTGSSNPGNPQVIVSFVYGSDDGSLTPMNIADQIQLSISSSEGNNWGSAQNDGMDGLTWTLTAPPTNPIGTGSNANVTFQLNQIIAMTAAGNMTQMVLQFLGFQQTDTVPYNPWLTFMSIDKLVGPANRGGTSFSSSTLQANACSPADPVTIPFTWTMNFVASVQISYVLEGITYTALNRPYGVQSAGMVDSANISVTGIEQDAEIVFTIFAFDENGNPLPFSSPQFRVFVQACFFLDPRDQQLYPAVQCQGLIWMTQNLTWRSYNEIPPGGSLSNVYDCGYLYLYSDASVVPDTPDRWRLPTLADWQTLTGLSYTDLISSNPGYPALDLAGYFLGQPLLFGTDACYWSSTPLEPSTAPYVQTIDVNSSSMSSLAYPTGPSQPGADSFYLSVRYVRDVASVQDSFS